MDHLFFQYCCFTNNSTAIPKKQISQDPFKGMHFYKDFPGIVFLNWSQKAWSLCLCRPVSRSLVFPTDDTLFSLLCLFFLEVLSWDWSFWEKTLKIFSNPESLSSMSIKCPWYDQLELTITVLMSHLLFLYKAPY